MASSFTLKRLVSTNLINRSPRHVGSATLASSSRFSGTDGQSLNSDRRADAPLSCPCDFHRFSGCLNVTDVTTSSLSSRLNQIINTVHSPIASGISSNGDGWGTMNGCLNVTDVTTSSLSRRLNQIINTAHSPIASGISSNGDGRGTMNGMYFSKGIGHTCLNNITDVTTSSLSRRLNRIMNIAHSPIASGNSSNGNGRGTMNGMHFSKGMSTMVIKGGSRKSSEEEETGRNFSTVAAHPEESYQKKSFRPLSPHLPIYKPQLSSTTSILNRISGIILTSTVLGSYLYLKVGSVAFTYENFYQFFYYSTNLVPIALEISALALAYHIYAGIGHLAADFSGKLPTSKKH